MVGPFSARRGGDRVVDRRDGLRADCGVTSAASKLAEVNVELERSAWGVFRTECYPAYDFVPVRERIKERIRKGGK